MTAARMPRAECDVAIVRQHTSVQTWVDSTAELLCMQIVGDHSVVVLGLTDPGADMLIRQISAGLDDLHAAKRNLTMTPTTPQVEVGGQ